MSSSPHPAREFQRAAAAKAVDPHHRAVIRKNMATYDAKVAEGRARFADWENARSHAAAIKYEAVRHLDRYLEQFEARVIENGGHVFWAETGQDAGDYIVRLAHRHNVRTAVKSKSMVTEEIHLNDALAAAGVRAVETDLGEFICQLRHEPPYHIVTPVMHLTRGDIARDFHDRFGTATAATAAELAGVAREHLRHEFLTADLGITGANFAVAETGMIALTENEGNARLSFALPPVHVAVLGIEKLVPRPEDLALLWPVLATSGTGQAITCYNSLIGGPRQPGEADGPGEFHVVLLDNGRTRLLADVEQRDALHCIRCGACLNICPVYRTVGGHTYATTYQGPIGAVITPHLRGAAEWSHLPYASSLCGACTDVCPVRVDLHHHLLHNRRHAVRQGIGPAAQHWAFRAWRWCLESAPRYALAGRLARFALRCGWAAALAKPWTRTRNLPPAPARSFREWWTADRAAERQSDRASTGQRLNTET